MPPKRYAQNSLEALFELYEQKMYRIAFAILHDEGQAENAVMDAFEKIMRQAGVPADPCSEEAKRLVSSAVRSCAIDQYRRNARERSTIALIENIGVHLPPDAQPAHDPVAEHLQQQSVAAMVDDLDEPYGAVVRERFLNDRTVRETAEQLGISEANVRKRQQRALNMLKPCVGRIA